jgi:transcriptional regulator with GAF, ATPase, and Fis domain
MRAMAANGEGAARRDQTSDLQLLVDSAPSLIHTSRPDSYLDFFNNAWLVVTERSMILCDTDTFSAEATWLRSEPEPCLGLQPVLINQERELIEAALAESRGRISGSDGAARRLGVPRTTLEYKIKSLPISKYGCRFAAREFSSGSRRSALESGVPKSCPQDSQEH